MNDTNKYQNTDCLSVQMDLKSMFLRIGHYFMHTKANINTMDGRLNGAPYQE